MALAARGRSGATGSPPDNDVLWCRGLTARRDGRPVLHGLSLGVRQSELLAVLGPRGAGKSTLLDCLGAVCPVDGGEVWFDSAPVHTLSAAGRERLRRHRFGYVGPRPRLLPELTAAENVAVAPMLRGARRREADRAAAEWLERMDLLDHARTRPDRLPPELRQRVAVARALAGSPSVLLADEPTAGLDTPAAERLLRLLTTAVRSHRVTLLLATTDAGTADTADRVVALRDGRLRRGAPGGVRAGAEGPATTGRGPAAARGDRDGAAAEPAARGSAHAHRPGGPAPSPEDGAGPPPSGAVPGTERGRSAGRRRSAPRSTAPGTPRLRPVDPVTGRPHAGGGAAGVPREPADRAGTPDHPGAPGLADPSGAAGRGDPTEPRTGPEPSGRPHPTAPVADDAPRAVPHPSSSGPSGRPRSRPPRGGGR